MNIKPLHVLGLISGSALEGIKATLSLTDGIDLYGIEASKQFMFSSALRDDIRRLFGKKITNPLERAEIEKTESEVTDFMVNIIEEFAAESDKKIDLVGIEGPQICHEPQNQYTYQLGKGRDIAQRTHFQIVTHFHNADILNGGQGAPLSASYCNALAQNLEKPVAFINVGGVTTLTWLGHYGEIMAFDCGPGNALIDDFMLKHAGVLMDDDGKAAAMGVVHDKIVDQMMQQSYIAKIPPKSAERRDFLPKAEHLEGLSVQDGAATATAFVAEAVAYSMALYLPEMPVQAFVCGGGAQNPTLVRFIRQKLKALNVECTSILNAGFVYDDAEAVGFLAARRIYNLPITFPNTTGVFAPMTGGEIYDEEHHD